MLSRRARPHVLIQMFLNAEEPVAAGVDGVIRVEEVVLEVLDCVEAACEA